MNNDNNVWDILRAETDVGTTENSVCLFLLYYVSGERPYAGQREYSIWCRPWRPVRDEQPEVIIDSADADEIEQAFRLGCRDLDSGFADVDSGGSEIIPAGCILPGRVQLSAFINQYKNYKV